MSFPYLLTSRQKEIAAHANRLASAFAQRAERCDAKGKFPHENFADLHANGFLLLPIPAAYGGGGADVLDMVIGLEQLARGDGASALVAAMTLNLIGRVADQRVWPEPILVEVCARLVADGGTVNTCVTEPEPGSISRGGVPATTATPAPGGWRINGRKIFVTGAPASRFLVTAAVLPPSEGAPRGEPAQAIVSAGAPVCA
jgi:alkylation response protein AidB-like acyl-CoA dehydrogenase